MQSGPVLLSSLHPPGPLASPHSVCFLILSGPGNDHVCAQGPSSVGNWFLDRTPGVPRATQIIQSHCPFHRFGNKRSEREGFTQTSCWPPIVCAFKGPCPTWDLGHGECGRHSCSQAWQESVWREKQTGKPMGTWSLQEDPGPGLRWAACTVQGFFDFCCFVMVSG